MDKQKIYKELTIFVFILFLFVVLICVGIYLIVSNKNEWNDTEATTKTNHKYNGGIALIVIGSIFFLLCIQRFLGSKLYINLIWMRHGAIQQKQKKDQVKKNKRRADIQAVARSGEARDKQIVFTGSFPPTDNFF